MHTYNGQRFLSGQPGDRSRSFARWANSRPEPEGDGYCQLFSRDWWLTCLAAFSLMFAIGGDVSVVAYIGACAWIAWRNLGLVWRTVVRGWPLLLLPALCMASTVWSDQRAVSLKQSAELALSVGLGLMICRRIDARGLAAALLTAGFLMCLLSLLYQRNDLRDPLVGLTGSKNQIAFIAQILLVSAVAVAADSKNSKRLRLFGLAGAGLGLLCVVLAHSAGIWVTAAVAIAALTGLSFFSRVAFGARVALVVLFLLALAPVVFAYDDIQRAAQTFQAQVLHKDASLTGRTELWTAAQSVIAESPVLGHGYDAFWQQGNLDAEALWRTNGIASRTGFNFHNQFLDIQVDLGQVGLAALVATLIYVGAGSIWRAIISPALSTAFMTSLLLALYLRLPVESTLVGAWNLATFLWVAVGVSAYSFRPEQIQSDIEVRPVGMTMRPSWRASRDRLRAAPRPSSPRSPIE